MLIETTVGNGRTMEHVRLSGNEEDICVLELLRRLALQVITGYARRNDASGNEHCATQLFAW